MADLPPLPDTQREHRDDGRPYFGHAVDGGRIRYASVSQIVIYDPHQEGGCNRRYAFIYVFGKKEEKSAAQLSGNDYARQLEHYLQSNEMVLSPVLRAAKHLIPRPGNDIHAEWDLALDLASGEDPALAALTLEERKRERAKRAGARFARAVALRESTFNSENDPGRAMIDREIRRLAGLTANGVPLLGAADYRHHRDEYIAEGGVVRRHDAGKIVVTIGDLKSTKRINDHTTRNGTKLSGYAKSDEAVLNHPQWLGYGVHAGDMYPDATHGQLEAIYAQTANGYTATKRGGLLEMGEIRERFLKYERMVGEMEQVAWGADKPEDVPVNLASCTQFGKPCPHSAYCDRPERTVHDMLVQHVVQIHHQGGGVPVSDSNGLGLFASLKKPEAAPLAAPPAVPTLSVDAHRAAVEAERARLAAEDAALAGAPPLPPGVASVAGSPPTNDLERALAKHDWWHMMSDDAGVARRGEEERKYILGALKSLPSANAAALWQKYAPKDMPNPFASAAPPLPPGVASVAAGLAVAIPRVVPSGCGAPGCGVGCQPGWVLSPAGGPTAYVECSSCAKTRAPALERTPVTACTPGKEYIVEGARMTFAMSTQGIYIFVDGASGTKQLPADAYVLEALPHPASVLPPDAPKIAPLDAAAPLSAEVRETITDPELRAKADAHAAAHAEREAANPVASKTTGRCGAGGRRIKTTLDIVASKKVNCPDCGKMEMRVKLSADKTETTIPPHNIVARAGAPVVPANGAPPVASVPVVSTMPVLVNGVPAIPIPPGVSGVVEHPAHTMVREQLLKEGREPLPTSTPPIPTVSYPYLAPGALPNQIAIPAVVAPPIPLPSQTDPWGPLVMGGERLDNCLALCNVFVEGVRHLTACPNNKVPDVHVAVSPEAVDEAVAAAMLPSALILLREASACIEAAMHMRARGVDGVAVDALVDAAADAVEGALERLRA